MVRTTVSAADVDRMVDVLDLVRLVEDRERDRLRRVVLARASGLSIQQCGRIWDKHRIGFDRRAMNDLQQRFIGQILVGLDKHFGLVRTSRGFRRLTVREIERRARANKRRAEEAEPVRSVTRPSPASSGWARQRRSRSTSASSSRAPGIGSTSGASSGPRA
jgi:hypothetical protein